MAPLATRIARWTWPLLVGAACSDATLPASPDEPPPGAQDVADPPAATVTPLRRLTRAQYQNTIAAALGDALDPALDVAAALPLDDQAGGFAANTVPATDIVVEQYERLAERISASLRPGPTLDCWSAGADATCGPTPVADLAATLYRRPLDDAEVARLHALRAETGVRGMVTALLIAPDFLYRVEGGQWLSPGLDRIALDGPSIAARMAFLLWAAPPDEALRNAAGDLTSPEARQAQLERMLADPRSRAGLARMHLQWLQLERLSHLVKDRNVFPNFSEAVGAQMIAEVERFVDMVVRHGDGTLATLLTSRRTLAQPGVVFWYGDDATIELEDPPPDAPEGARVLTLDPEHRAGLLTLVSVLAAHAKPDLSDPIRRGAMIRERLLCQPLLAAPPDVPPAPAAPDPGASVREQLEQHRADPSCAVCHDLADPIGFALESYDAMGRFRTEDAAGNAIDDRGEVVQSDLEGPLQGGVALATALSGSEQVQRCYATQWFRYAYGRLEDPDDRTELAALQDGFVSSGGHIPSLLTALVTSEAFVHRRLP
ncbi:MAG: DUF1588 domain-containing protein [Myxococcota bacterium]